MRGKKKYRDTFAAAHLSTNIAAQIQITRETRGWRQKDLAEKADMSPARISVMENPSYDKFNISTLRRLASAFDVALIVRFVPFSELVDWVATLSPEKLDVPEFARDVLRHDGEGQRQVPLAALSYGRLQAPSLAVLQASRCLRPFRGNPLPSDLLQKDNPA